MAFLTVAFKLFFATGFFAATFLATGFLAGAFFTAFFLEGTFFTAAFTVVFLAQHFLQQAFFATFFVVVFLTAAFFTGFFFVVIFLPFMDLLLITHPFVYDIKINMSTKKCIFFKKNLILLFLMRIIYKGK